MIPWFHFLFSNDSPKSIQNLETISAPKSLSSRRTMEHISPQNLFFLRQKHGMIPPKMPGKTSSTFQVNHRLTLRAMHGLAEALALQGDFGPAEATL